MKSQQLLERKAILQEQRKKILHEISEKMADMKRQDLERFIASGDSTQINGHSLERLQRQRLHLNNLENSLDAEITKLRKAERVKKLQKLERRITELEEKRKGTFYQRYLHFQSKIKALQEQDKQLKEEVTTIRSETFEFCRQELEIHFRLPELEKMLKANYIQKPEELQELVKKAYEENEKSLHPGKDDLGSKLVRGYKLTLNRDSGEIIKIEPLTCSVGQARDHPVIISEVRKE